MLRTLQLHGGATQQIHVGGWHKQMNDPRDEEFRIKLHPALAAQLASSVDKRGDCSPVRNQGPLGACTAFMRSALVEYNERVRVAKLLRLASSIAQVQITNVQTSGAGIISFSTQVTPAVVPTPTPPPTPSKSLVQDSTLFGYLCTRKIEGTINSDAGGTIRDAIKGGVTYGCCDETLYPYDPSKFTQNPSQAIWTEATGHKITSYHAISDGDITTMKATLAGDLLVGFGFQVYDNALSPQVAQTGLLPVPKAGEQLQGGHAVALVGYDDNKVMPDGYKGAFIVRNSWSADWGLAGYFYMSYNYVGNTRLASDFWVCQSAPI